MEEVLQSKPVQEIALSCNGEIPEQFIHKDGFPQSKVDSVSYMDDFVIDFSLVFSPSSPESDHELGKLRLALSQWGCFQAINHGMTNDFLDKIREVGKQFFALPLEEKQKYSRGIDDWDGYGNDAVVSKQQTLDWMDRLYLTVNPEDQRKLKYWPEKPVAFREIINEYTLKLRVIFDLLMKAMAQSLNLDDNCFLKEHGDMVTMFARFNFYPPCPTPESVLGVKPHADGVTFTVLLQDKEVEGLQVLKDDQWFKVPIVPDALFVNVGDMLEIMSNGILKSPVHRVVTNSEKEKISVIVFCFSDFDREIGPIAELITQDRPQMYKRVRHYEKVFFENYQNGKRPLHAILLGHFHKAWEEVGDVSTNISLTASRLSSRSKHTFGNFAKELRESKQNMSKLMEKSQTNETIAKMYAIDEKIDELGNRGVNNIGSRMGNKDSSFFHTKA